MADDLKQLQKYVDRMRGTTSTKEKEKILAHYEDSNDVRNLVWWVLNPYKTFGITSQQVRKASYKVDPTYNPVNDIETLLRMLSERKWTGHFAVAEILGFIEANKEHEALIYQIIDKDIETRANATLVNKIWGKGFVPKFEVALAKKYDDYSDKIFAMEYDWYQSRKLDGLRCVIVISLEGNARFYSRTGKEFFTLGVLADRIRNCKYLYGSVLDGEVCIMNGDLEDFKAIHSEYNKKDHTIVNPKYFIFDCLTPEEFENGESDTYLMDRLAPLTYAVMPENLEILKQHMVTSQEDVDCALIAGNALGHEGLILRKNCEYKGKRSADVLKVKSFMDAEFVVKGIQTGFMRFIEDSRDVERETMTKAIINYKGNEVGVGSGWSKEERETFFNHPHSLIGREITVKYKQESFDSDGNVSLQFPTVKTIHYTHRRDS